MRRVTTAIILLPALWLLVKRAPLWTFVAVAALATVIAVWECARMLRTAGGPPFAWLAMLAAALIVLRDLSGMPFIDPLAILLGLTIVALVVSMWSRPDPASMLRSVCGTLFPVVLIGGAISAVVQLRLIGGEFSADLLLLLFLCITMGDTFAYYTGKNLGRHPLALALSPKKTWEGAAGALLGSTLAALLAHFWFFTRLPLRDALILGIVLGGVGILGDLAESVIKRATGVKDSSGLLPGHGGLLDRIDSLLFAGPVLFLYYHGLLRGLN